MCLYVCAHTPNMNRGFIKKMGGGGGGGAKQYLRKTWGGGAKGVHDSVPSRGVWGHFEFIPSEVHFQTHLWFSNDMMR